MKLLDHRPMTHKEREAIKVLMSYNRASKDTVQDLVMDDEVRQIREICNQAKIFRISVIGRLRFTQSSEIFMME